MDTNLKAVYDEKIAPKLASIAEECEDLGLSFVAAIESAPDSVAVTALILPGAGRKIRLAHASLIGIPVMPS